MSSSLPRIELFLKEDTFSHAKDCDVGTSRIVGENLDDNDSNKSCLTPY